MANTESSVSAAVEFAWKIGSRIARSAGDRLETAHLLYGIFSLNKITPENLTEHQWAEVQAEVKSLEEKLQPLSVTPQEIRRNIRRRTALSIVEQQSEKRSASSGSLPQSDSCLKAFEEAASVPRMAGQPQVSLLPLTRCLLEHEPDAGIFLGLEQAALGTLLDTLREPAGRLPSPESSSLEESPEIVSVFASLNADAVHDGAVNWARVGKHFASLCELSWRAGTTSKVETLFQDSIRELIAAIPSAEQAAVMMPDRCGDMLLKAHFPKGLLPVSSSSARKAMSERQSFIWQRGEDLSASQRDSNLRAGIYAPILAAGEAFGALCLDASAAASRFTEDDLFLVTFVGHQLGLALANRTLEENLRGTARLLERLLTNFSPQVRSRLLAKAEAGRLKLGGERSVISILCSDIRGFTMLTADMDVDDVVGMLNDYFSALVSVVFKHGGSIDKFIGDAIMAVFGSPEADTMHPQKSLRAALEMQAEVNRVSRLRKVAGLPCCEIGIGVHTGEVIHGFIGSTERMEFTVIGNAVNLASRFCAAARGGEVIISPELLERVWKKAVVEAIEIPTKHEGSLSAFRVLRILDPD